MTEFYMKDFLLKSGEILHEAKLSYHIYGSLNAAKDNLIVFPTYFTGRQRSNEPYFGPKRAIDPGHDCIVVPCLIGNGDSSSPSHAHSPRKFPKVTIHDNVRLQRALLDHLFPGVPIALLIGWSMGGCQAFEWAVQAPERVQRLLPICATAKCSPNNIVFLEGVKAALEADQNYLNGTFPELGLRAFGRVYAGWAYSREFFDAGEFRQLGFENLDELLEDWEKDHLSWHPDDLLCKIWTWKHADVSNNSQHNCNLERALRSIRAKSLVVPVTTDKYFTLETARWETSHIPGAQLRPFDSSWGHCAATPSRPHPNFMSFIDEVIRELMLEAV